MVDVRENLAPIHSQLKRQLKREDQLREIAERYITAESDRVFWFDLMAELRGAFASDALWLTEFEPLTGFDTQALVSNEAKDAKFQNGQSVVSDNFMQVDYGLSALASLPEPRSRPGSRRQKAETPKVNAVLIRGYWRENPRSQNLVSDMLKQLQEKSTSFDFMVEKGKGRNKETINLTADQFIGRILKVASEPTTPEDLAQPFEIILPLARGVEFK